MNIRKEITKEEVKELPLWRYEGEIELIESSSQLSAALNYLSGFPYIGFDTEAKPAFKKGQYNPVCLVQFACKEKVFLIRNRISGFTDSLVEFLENPKVIKVGAGIKDDIKDLQYWRPFEPAGFEDLNTIVHNMGFVNSGVRNLAALILERRISKNQQTTNWERDELTDPQKIYAATDAWVCYEIYHRLKYQGWI